MTPKSSRAAAFIFGALVLVGVAVWQTGTSVATFSPRGAKKRTTSDRSIVFDHSSLTFAELLARLPTSADEQPLAEDAYKIQFTAKENAFLSVQRCTQIHSFL